jgi:hypothetical protein
MSDDTGGVLLQHYRDQLIAERERKQSLERRGQAVVATNGAIVSLLLAFDTITVDSVTSTSSAWVTGLFVAAMVALTGSAVLGLLANRPERYAETNVDMLVKVAEAEDNWTGALAANRAQREVASDIAKVIKAAKPSRYPAVEHVPR